jgi:hypothetical protein
MYKNLILSKSDTNSVYKALLDERIVRSEDSTTEWAKNNFRR